MKKISLFIFIIIVITIFIPRCSFASIGVGVGSGKITLNEGIKPGGIYELPTLPVLNTGDEPSEYTVSLQYNEVQSQMKPKSEWFHFEPTTFYLLPGKSQIVKITADIPVKTTPGEYFAYLEAHPVKNDVAGVSSIGVAAASKLYFTVIPANFFQGLYYRTVSLFTKYSPWAYIVLGLIVLFILVKLFRRFFHFKIAINVKSDKE
jgi:hypothetical protein